LHLARRRLLAPRPRLVENCAVSRALAIVLVGALAAAARAEPPAKTIAKRPTLAAVGAHKWIAVGDSYFRLWGGTETGSLPKGVSVAPDGARVFTTNFGYHDRDNTWSYDPDTLVVHAKAKFPGNAIESVPSPDGRTLYVSNFYHREIVALDADTLAVARRFRVDDVPKGLALSPDAATMWVSNWESNTVSVVDVATGEVSKRVKVGTNPRGTVVTHDGAKVYITNFGSRSVSVIDAATAAVTKTIRDVCSAPRHAAALADDSLVLVSCYGGHEVVAIDVATDKVVHRVEVGEGPKTIEISRDQQFAYTADYRGNTMSIIDLATWRARVIPVPTIKTSGLAVAPDDRRIYLTGWDSMNLLVIERLMPGDEIGVLGPKLPRVWCHRVNKEECTQFP
jgi:YVTN family beta-propeller protein